MEIKAIKNFPGYYVNSQGEVYSLKKIKLVKHNGYNTVTLCNKGQKRKSFVHRLVAEAFLSNPENKPVVNHKNGIRNDNRVSNLEWTTQSENLKHSYRVLGHNPNKGGGLFGKFGKKHPRAKKIIQINQGKIIREFYGFFEASRETGINTGNIWACCNGKLKTAGGFEWRYVNKD